MTLPTLASAEAVAITWLLSLSVVSTAVSDRVSTVLDGDDWQIRVRRTGGTLTEDPWYDTPRVQVEFWGPSTTITSTVTDEQVDQLCRDVCAQVPYMRGSIGGAVVTSSLTSIGPLPSPDPVTNRYRQLIEITFEMESA